MADYHIYIHSENGSGNKTQPFSTRKDQPFIANQNAITTEKSEALESISGIEGGTSSVTKVAAVIAVAKIIHSLADKVLTTGFSHLTEYTGHYEYEMAFNNYKTSISNTLHPIKTIQKLIHRNKQFEKNNIRIAEEAKVIGKTVYSDYKIGV